MSDLISRQEAISEVQRWVGYIDKDMIERICRGLKSLPSAEPKYTDRELEVFRHGISLRLLGLRSAQHWRYDEDTAEIIVFLEQLYEKVGADMREESKNAKPDM